MMGLRRRRPRLSAEDERVLTMAKGAARAGIWGLAPAQSAEEQAAAVAAGTSLPGEAGGTDGAFAPAEPLVLSALPAALAAADAEFMRQFPALIAHGEASGRRRLGPVWHATPAAETRPMSAVPAGMPPPPARVAAPPLPRRQPALPRRRPARALAASASPDDLAAALEALRDLDFTAVDEARKTQGATHASVRQARGAAPFHDAVLKAWQPLQGPRLPGAEHLGPAISRLKYPPLGSPASAYADVLGWATAITGTPGFPYRQWPLLAIAAGGAA
jgi:hypothetical protein